MVRNRRNALAAAVVVAVTFAVAPAAPAFPGTPVRTDAAIVDAGAGFLSNWFGEAWGFVVNLFAADDGTINPKG